MTYNPHEWTKKKLDPNIASECMSDEQAEVMLELQNDISKDFGIATGDHWDKHRKKDRSGQYKAAKNALEALKNYASVAEDYALEDLLHKIELPEISNNSHSMRYKQMYKQKAETRLDAIGTTQKIKVKLLTELMKLYK